MSGVTAWVGEGWTRRYPQTLGVTVVTRGAAGSARHVYRAMRRAGMESWEARGHVVSLLVARTEIVTKGGTK